MPLGGGVLARQPPRQIQQALAVFRLEAREQRADFSDREARDAARNEGRR